MPSWNIHTAHVERLLQEASISELGIDDANAFLFGNYVPDIYVGYMVKHPTRLIEYHETHLAPCLPVPVPDFRAFWRRYIASDSPSDITLGAWAHLVCDGMYNGAVRRWNAARKIESGEQVRIRKQHDFDLFGKTFALTMSPEVTPALVMQAAAFPPYTIFESDVRAAVAVAQDITSHNSGGCDGELAPYALLSQSFFCETFESVHKYLMECLISRTHGRDIRYL